MQEIWAQIENWLGSNAPQALDVLQPGASDAEIAELEAFLAVQLPEDFKSSYRIHNGQLSDGYGLIKRCEFLSLNRIKHQWQVWKELLDSGTFQADNGQDQGCEPAPGVCNVWWHSKWIPFTYDGGGNHECLDLSPAAGGTVGQVITMWHDDPAREITAPSFRAWLTQYAEGLESGRLIFSEEHYGIVSVDDI